MDVSAARRCRVAVGAVTTAVTLLFSQSGVAGQGEWWQTLKYRTAWVLLGVVSSDGREWTTEPLHVFRGENRKRSSVIPRRGDLIEITRDGVQIEILDYKNQGERFADVSLAAHRASPNDIVGAIGRGTRVVVEQVVRAQNPGPQRSETVFVRIAPENAVDRRPLP